MFDTQKRLSFSIRKLSVGVASALIGVAWLLATGSTVAANQENSSLPIRYRYVLESELSAEEKLRVASSLTTQEVNELDTYYMVYRPVAQSTGQKEQQSPLANEKAETSSSSGAKTMVLPQTNTEDPAWLALAGGGLLLLGVLASKGKRRKVLLSLLVLTASGQVLTVSAIEGHQLSTYNKDYQLALGAPLPETAIHIAGYEFVGYIVEDQLPATKTGADQASASPQDPATSLVAHLPSTSGQATPSAPQTPNPASQPSVGTPTDTPAPPTSGQSTPSQTEQVSYETLAEVIAFTETQVANDQLPVGTQELVTAGREGRLEKTFKVTVRADGSVIRQEIASREVLAPVNQVIAVGTKVVPAPPSAPLISTVDEPIAYETEVVEDPTRPLGEELVIQEGQPGLKRLSYTDGQLTGEQVVTAPVKHIISRGSQTPVAQPTETETTEPIPYSTEIVEDSSLPIGSEELVQEGQDGWWTVKFLDGQMVSRLVTQEPLPRIIKRGTKVTAPLDKARLQAQVDLAMTKSESAYTADSFAQVLAARQQALSLLANPNSSQADLDSQAELLATALNQLVVKPVDTLETKEEFIAFTTETIEDPTLPLGEEKEVQPGRNGVLVITYTNGVETSRHIQTPAQTRIVHVGTKAALDKQTLENSVAKARVLIETDYSPESWAVMAKSLGQAQVLLDKTDLEQSDLDAAHQGLEEAVARLSVDKAPLTDLVDRGLTLSAQDYSPSSWSVLTVALKQSQATLAKPNLKQSELNASRLVLQAALSALSTDKTALTALLERAQTLSSSDYSSASWSGLATPLQAARSVLGRSDATQSELDQAQTVLQTALSALSTDKTALTALLERAQTLSSSDYSPASWSGLATPLQAARSVLGRSDVTQSELDQAQTVLQTALSALSTDKTALDVAVSEGQRQVAADYSPASWTQFELALTEARQILTLPTANQSQINQAQERLETARLALGVDRQKLDQQLALAQAVKGQTYTKASLAEVESALAATQDLVLKQSVIDTAANRLEKALADLVKLKEKPSLQWLDLAEDGYQRSVTANYQLTDADKSYQSSHVKVYDGDRLVQTVPIEDLSSLIISGLDEDISYRLVTEMAYDLGDGSVTEQVGERLVRLNFKKIEIKDIDSVTLSQFKDGETRRIRSLSDAPRDVSSYFVRVSSDRFRDMLLPVASIELANLDGKEAFKVTAQLPELVEDTDESAAVAYQDNFSFYIRKQDQTRTANVYTSFADLVTAITANPTGTYILGADLFADEVAVAKTATAYIPTRFTGKLLGSKDNQSHAIHGLTLPLFNELAGSVSDLDLKDVNILSQSDRVGALAKTSLSGTVVTNVAAKGRVVGNRIVGGLIGRAESSQLENLSFEGKVSASNVRSGGDNYVGGIVARMENGNLNRAFVDAAIDGYVASGGHKVSAVVGSFYSTRSGKLSNLYAKGTVTNLSKTTQGASGLVGSIYINGRLENAITEVKVVGGAYVNSDTPHRNANVDTKTVFAVTGVATASTQETWTRFTSPEEARAKVLAMNLTATTSDSTKKGYNKELKTDYTSLTNASAERAIAYNNIEKLLPFYDKQTIVKYGNKVETSSKLYTTELISVTPMVDNQILADVHGQKTALNRLMLHYADKTVAYLDLAYQSDFKNTAISEYSIKDTSLIYTPEQMLSNYDHLVNRLTPVLASVHYKSQAMVDLLGATPTEAEIAKRATDSKVTEAQAREALVEERMDRLYLEEQFEQIKADLPTYIRNLLATDKSINISDGVIADAIVDYISDHKDYLLLGLAYMQRWYNIDFSTVNTQSLATYHQDFYGKPVNTIEWLVSLGQSGYTNLQPFNNLSTYRTYLANQTGQQDLPSYLTTNRELFTTYTNDNDWFKAATKAYVVEMASKERPDADVRIYSRLTSNEGDSRGILPLLSAQEGIFLLSNMTTLTYGMFDRYMDMGLKTKNPEEYAKKRAEVEAMAQRAGKWQADHFDFWYRIANEDVKEKLIRANPMPTWDGYMVRGKWLPMFGATANQAIRDFFGPIERGRIANNGAGAYANGHQVFYVNNNVLDAYGTSVFTHEVVHNQDGSIYLGGYGRRDNTGAEHYALGLLQAVTSATGSDLGINSVFDFTADKNHSRLSHNTSPNRFRNQADINDYVRHLFDVLYTLDYAEAELVLGKDQESKKRWYNQLITSNDERLATAERKELDDAVSLTSIADLINHEVISDKYKKGITDGFNLKSNGYWKISLFDPIYATGAGPKGYTGDIMFRRMAYEVFAYKGYQDGFLAYASNKLKASATQAGQNLTDDFIISTISDGKYQTMKAFKLAMFEERKAKAANLKPISFTYNDRTYTITNYDDLKATLQEAVDRDLRVGSNTIGTLKQHIYSAYMKATDEFRQSIYKP